MKWMVPINGLGAQQASILEKVVTDNTKTHWIAGYAGTGKTIVITHALERLVAKSRNAKICFLTYTHALKDLVHSGLSKSVANQIIVETVDTFLSNRNRFDYIVVDEIQDIKEASIEEIFGRTKFVIAAGDPDQSIYLGRIDPTGLKKILRNAQKHTLKHIQRLSLKTFQIAASILPEADIVKGAEVKDEGRNAKIIACSTKKEEYLKVFTEAVRVSSIGQPSAILFPTHDQIYEFAAIVSESKNWGVPPKRTKNGPILSYEAFNNFFTKKNAPLRFLGSNNGSLPESDNSKLIYLMTYHSSKGLDFNNVFLPDLTSKVRLDAKGIGSNEERERRHFFVAVTRSKENVYLSYHGTRHPILELLPDDCVEKFIPPRSSFVRT